ncbi:hypothetical protein D910_07934 [Dendroctonus ponderosae]|uniref:DDE Tnp4 domain-containing protein n=1 Tax=Dendroctonus ponderosae TaxID=77166 RepID=U4UBZ8_DENPD|nr:hypothetical protein D910_07934 [Dendroctonus ponderosae]
MVSPFVREPTRESALSIRTKVLATLRFFGTGSYQEVTGSNNFVGISQASASRAITEISNALNEATILNRLINYPQTIAELEALRTSCGCIDCTHIAIVAPHKNDPNFPEHVYVCDSNLKILNVNSKFPGSCHDSHIWRQSPVSDFMETVHRRNRNNVFFLFGDSGYPTRPWLLTPINNARNLGEERFNDRLCSIRSVIERCNAVLKNRFRCLLRYRTLHYSPSMAGKITNACCVLHNLCIANRVPEVEEPHPVKPDYGMYALNQLNFLRPSANVDLAAARALQQHIINTHFT